MSYLLFVLVGICAFFVARKMMRNLGIGTDGKPDCGCGSGSACSHPKETQP